MNKLKFICCVVAASLIVTSVFAAPEANVITIKKDANNVISTQIKYSESHTGLGNVYIVPEANLNNAKGGDLSTAVFVGEKGLTDGKVIFDFLMKTGASDGVYVAVSGESSDDGISKRMRYFVYDADGSNATKLNELNVATTDFESKLTSNTSVAWYLDTASSAWTNNRAQVVSLVKTMRPFSSTFEVEEAFIVACKIADIANLSNDEVLLYLESFETMLGCDVQNLDYKVHKSDTLTKFINVVKLSELSDKNEKSEIVKLFRTACALTRMSNTNRTTAIQDLKDYNDVLLLNFGGDYTTLSADSVAELAKTFENKNYTTVSQIEKDFNDGVNALKPPQEGGYQTPVLNGSPRVSFGTGGFTGVGSVVINDINNNKTIFPDVPNTHWAVEYIKFVYENGIMSGDSDGNFRPDDPITREEWAKVVLEAFAVALGEEKCEFTDVDTSAWYYPYVAKAYMLGVVNGISKETFGVGMNLTRQDAVVMMHRMTVMARDIVSVQPVELTFTDKDSISEYALYPIQIFTALKIINGYEDGSFNSQGAITRAEAAKIIYSLLNELDK